MIGDNSDSLFVLDMDGKIFQNTTALRENRLESR